MYSFTLLALRGHWRAAVRKYVIQCLYLIDLASVCLSGCLCLCLWLSVLCMSACLCPSVSVSTAYLRAAAYTVHTYAYTHTNTLLKYAYTRIIRMRTCITTQFTTHTHVHNCPFHHACSGCIHVLACASTQPITHTHKHNTYNVCACTHSHLHAHGTYSTWHALHSRTCTRTHCTHACTVAHNCPVGVMDCEPVRYSHRHSILMVACTFVAACLYSYKCIQWACAEAPNTGSRSSSWPSQTSRFGMASQFTFVLNCS